MSDAPRITDLELAAMESRARLVGSANCWTGTGGSIAADAFRLIAEVRRLRSIEELMLSVAETRRLLAEVDASILRVASAATTPEGDDDA